MKKEFLVFRACLNLYCENGYSLFLSEKSQNFATIAGSYREKFNEFAAIKKHKQIIRGILNRLLDLIFFKNFLFFKISTTVLKAL